MKWHVLTCSLQVDGVRRIDANDLDDTAAAAVRQNLELNDSRASGLVRPIHGDVRMAALRVCFILFSALLRLAPTRAAVTDGCISS